MVRSLSCICPDCTRKLQEAARYWALGRLSPRDTPTTYACTGSDAGLHHDATTLADRSSGAAERQIEVRSMDKPTISLIRSQCFVGGQWIGDGKLPVTNKATGDVITRVPEFGEGETRRAIDAAHAALPGWSKRVAKERSKLIRAWYDSILEHADELALLLSNEQGKPLAEAKGEILYAAGFIEFLAEEAKRVYGETIPTFKTDARIVVIKQPVGVVAAITPWNFPAAMITRKAGPALAVGCTMVLKPASETPLTALALAALAEKAGIPKGVFNVITGKASVIGKELTG